MSANENSNDVPRLNKHRIEKIFGGIWIEGKEEFAKFVSAVNNYAFEENGQGIAYTDDYFYAYYINIDGQVIPYAAVKLTAEQSQEVVNQVNKEIENVREGERVKKYIDTGLERAWSIQGKDNAKPLNNSGASNRRRNGGVVSDLLRKGRYFDNPSLYVKAKRADRFGIINRTGNGEFVRSARRRAQMAEVASHFDGKELSAEQRAVVDVFGGKADNLTISVKTQDGNVRKVVMRQGNEMGAGAKHSLYRHYGTGVGVITSDDIISIPDVVANGVRTEKQRGKTRLAEYKLTDANGNEFTVLTEIKKGKEIFNDFYSNKKAPLSGTFNTQSAHTANNNALSTDKGSDNSLNEQEESTLFRKVTDPFKVAELEAGEKIKVYRAMQLIDGKLYHITSKFSFLLYKGSLMLYNAPLFCILAA